MRRRKPALPAGAPSPRPLRRRRLGAGMLALALIVVVLMGMQWYRGHQVSSSCTDNGGRWDAERQRCTFGGSDRIPEPPEPAPQ